MAERTGFEPATSGVTGRYSNQLNYRSMRRLALRANASPGSCFTIGEIARGECPGQTTNSKTLANN